MSGHHRRHRAHHHHSRGDHTFDVRNDIHLQIGRRMSINSSPTEDHFFDEVEMPQGMMQKFPITMSTDLKHVLYNLLVDQYNNTLCPTRYFVPTIEPIAYTEVTSSPVTPTPSDIYNSQTARSGTASRSANGRSRSGGSPRCTRCTSDTPHYTNKIRTLYSFKTSINTTPEPA